MPKDSENHYAMRFQPRAKGIAFDVSSRESPREGKHGNTASEISARTDVQSPRSRYVDAILLDGPSLCNALEVMAYEEDCDPGKGARNSDESIGGTALVAFAIHHNLPKQISQEGFTSFRKMYRSTFGGIIQFSRPSASVPNLGRRGLTCCLPSNSIYSSQYGIQISSGCGPTVTISLGMSTKPWEDGEGRDVF